MELNLIGGNGSHLAHPVSASDADEWEWDRKIVDEQASCTCPILPSKYADVDLNDEDSVLDLSGSIDIDNEERENWQWHLNGL